MGLIEALRNLFNFHSLNKIEKAIDGLSKEERSELFEWMTSQLDETEDKSEDESEKFDPDFWESTGPHQGTGGGMY